VVHVAARRRGRSRAGRPVFVRLATAVPAALAVLLFSAEPVAVPRPARITLLFHLDLVDGAEAGLLVVRRRVRFLALRLRARTDD
jgi:hypothetical protein